jgi:hypothetical protein
LDAIVHSFVLFGDQSNSLVRIFLLPNYNCWNEIVIMARILLKRRNP